MAITIALRKKPLYFDLVNQNPELTNTEDISRYAVLRSFGDEQEDMDYFSSCFMFLDLVIGAVYTSLPEDTPIVYNSAIKNSFFSYFDSMEKYEQELNFHLNYLKTNFKHFTNTPEKERILSDIREELDKVNNIQLRIRDIAYTPTEYTNTACRILKRYEEQLQLLYLEYTNISSSELEAKYYKSYPGISTPQHPLAFFQQLVDFGDRQKVVQAYLENEHTWAFYENEGATLEDYFTLLYRREYYYSQNFIETKLASITLLKDRQKYVNNLVLQVEDLYNRSAFLSGFKNFRRPYTSLLRWLQKRNFRIKKTLLTKAILVPEYIPLHEDKDFILKLLNLKYTDNEGKEIKLLNNKDVTATDIKHFLLGEFSKIKKPIIVAWERAPAYFLLSKINQLVEPGKSLPSLLRRDQCKHIQFLDTSSPFSPGSCRNTLCDFNKSKLNLPGNALEVINQLFKSR